MRGRSAALRLGGRLTAVLATAALLLQSTAASVADGERLMPRVTPSMISGSIRQLPTMSQPPEESVPSRSPSAVGGAQLGNRLDQPDTARQWKLWLSAMPSIEAEAGKTQPTEASERPMTSAAREGGHAQGVGDAEIRFGMASAFTGAAKESGENMKVGIEVAFAQANDAGGIDGRKLRLITADDGYEPSRTIPAMQALNEQSKVLGYIGQFGTATAMVAAPYALEHKMLFFGAFSGSEALRRDPPDRYVFNYRPGYADETEAVVKYLVRTRHIQPNQIAIFAQDDGFGQAGIEGVKKAMRDLRGEQAPEPLVMTYKRNTIDIASALHLLASRRKVVKAVVMVATYRAAAHFIEKSRELAPNLVFTDVSGVGSTSLADELMLLGPEFARGVVVTQVVPSVDSYASAILDYKAMLARYAPGAKPDYVSLEGFIDARLLIAGLRRAGPDLDTEKLVDALEQINNLDLGFGTPLSFGPSRHQASPKVWGTVLNDKGHYEPINLN